MVTTTTTTTTLRTKMNEQPKHSINHLEIWIRCVQNPYAFHILYAFQMYNEDIHFKLLQLDRIEMGKFLFQELLQWRMRQWMDFSNKKKSIWANMWWWFIAIPISTKIKTWFSASGKFDQIKAKFAYFKRQINRNGSGNGKYEWELEKFSWFFSLLNSWYIG